MTGYGFHPEARTDLDNIHEYIAADNPEEADRVISDILARICGLVRFQEQGHRVQS